MIAPRSLARRRVRLGVAVLATVVAVGTLWYWLIEDFEPLDAVFQTVTTISTVGFREVHRLDASGQVFTMVLILIGVGAALYTLTGVFEELVEAQVGGIGRRRMDRRLERLRRHSVVCGYGRIGARVAELLHRDGEVLVIEHDPERAVVAVESDLVVVQGDATDDATLSRAGLERAATLVSALPTDADNLYVVLSGRAINPELRIVARAQSVRSDAKLVRAGADRVVNPEDIGAQRLAAFAQRPMVSEFLDVVMHGAVEYRLEEEVVIPPDSPLDGCTVREAGVRDRTGALVLGLRTEDGSFITNPAPETPLAAGSVLIAIGTDAQLDALVRYATAATAADHRGPSTSDR